MLQLTTLQLKIKSQKIAAMNQINPNKLLLSKWTAVKPKKKERHFMVTKLIYAENEDIIGCELEAVISNNLYEIDWKDLKDSSCWLIGWK